MDIIEVGKIIEEDLHRLTRANRRKFDATARRITRAVDKGGDQGIGALMLCAYRVAKRFIDGKQNT